VAISPDSRWLVTGSEDKTARLWDLTAKDPAAAPIVLRGHEAAISCVAISPDSRWLVTGSGDMTARLWQLRLNELMDLARRTLGRELVDEEKIRSAVLKKTLDLGGGVTMEMVCICPRTFTRGKGENRHEVIISKPFYLGVTEVTQAQYQAIMGKNPSWFKGATKPVDGVSWNDATEFCKRLSQKTHQTVRLPTDAEWECACRAGVQTAYSFGDDPSALGDYAWNYSNSGGTTHPVGQKKPNAWGLYDMHGNVWEWCADWFGVDPKGPATDPPGPATGTLRVQRGGSVGNPDDDVLRNAVRAGNSPASRLSYNGFRCAMTLP
jgi:formylglycine-generating enzyme required for sulfatase activity